LLKRRCLIPATGFYECQKHEDGKQPYRFRRKDLEPFAFAGVWEFARLGGEDTLSAVMLVGEANSLVGAVHDRMPVMLMSEDYDRWLGPTREPHVYAAPWRTFFLGDLVPNRSDEQRDNHGRRPAGDVGAYVRCWHIADVPLTLTNVGFEGKNGHDALTPFPLMTRSGRLPLWTQLKLRTLDPR
jgi:SOS response associated peptidase (SRAP)